MRRSLPTIIDLRCDRVLALHDFYVRYAGLEPSIGDLPDNVRVEFAPDTRRHHLDRLYKDRGSHWPRRLIVQEAAQ